MEETSQRILNLGLQALYSEREKLNGEIATIERQLGRSSGSVRKAGKHRLSSAGRKAISDAMKKRWAAHRMSKASKKR